LPGSRFPLNYDSESPSAILLPHLTALRSCSQTLQLRSLAELQYGQPEKALADVKLALQLTGNIRTEPFLISHLVRIRMVNLTLQPITKVWRNTNGQTRNSSNSMQNWRSLIFWRITNCPCAVKWDARGAKRIACVVTGTLEGLNGMNDGEGGVINQLLPGKLVVHLIPTGWFYQNQLRCARVMVDYYLPVADVNRGTVSPASSGAGMRHCSLKPKPPLLSTCSNG